MFTAMTDVQKKIAEALLGVLFVALVLGGVWVAFSSLMASAEARGFEKARKEYAAQIAEYKKQVAVLEQREVETRETLTDERTRVVADLGVQLSAAESRAQAAEFKLARKKAYVTPKADSLCVVPAGAVELLREAAGASPAQGSPTLAESRPEDADRASGVALSELTGVLAADISECVVRGEVIQAWQSWYRQNQQLWEDYRKSFQEPPNLQ